MKTHTFTEDDIDPHAVDVVERLKKAGFEAYFVGGCVRDLLLRKSPKDFDIATNAHPPDIKRIFRNCRLIGKRFRLAHIFFGRKIIEVATFRGPHDGNNDQIMHEKGMIMRDNVYGTLEEDAWRRDFTINALFYDPHAHQIIDHVGGLKDLENKTLRIIGSPAQRYREDPVRMLRAIRFAAKLGFSLDKDTLAPLYELGELLRYVSNARLFDEVVKLFHGGYALDTFELLQKYDLFKHLFPETAACLAENDAFCEKLLRYTLQSTDARIHAAKPVTPAFLFSACLWRPIQHHLVPLLAEGIEHYAALELALQTALRHQRHHTAIPRFLTLAMRDIWLLQQRLELRLKPEKLLDHPRFRASYDFLVLRSRSGEIPEEVSDWWTKFQAASEAEQKEMSRSPHKLRRKRRRKKNAAQIETPSAELPSESGF